MTTPPLIFSQNNGWYTTNYCGWCWRYVNNNPVGTCMSNYDYISAEDSCENDGNAFDTTYAYYDGGTPRCPISQSGLEVSAYFTIAWLSSCSLLVLGAVPAFYFLRTRAAATSPESRNPEVAALFAWRIGVVCIIFGSLSLGGTFAFVSSILTLCGGAITVSTMRSFKSASRIVGGRSRNCSHPLHGANLSIAAAVFSIAEAAVITTLLVDRGWMTYLMRWYFSPAPAYNSNNGSSYDFFFLQTYVDA